MPKIVSARNVGKHRCHDLEVAHPDHQFFLANRLLTSNSHSDAYSVVTMQTAHLATYHPLEFYSAQLTLGAAAELQDDVSDIKHAGVEVMPVDINMSKGAHVIERQEDGHESIRLSLSSVLGVGASAIAKIVAGQPYTDFIDFLDRAGATKTAVHPLIKVGAFDAISHGMGLREVEKKYEAICANPKLRTKKMRDELYRMWAEVPAEPDYGLHEKVFFENELMGFSVRGSPWEILDRDRKLAQLGDQVTDYAEFLESDEPVGMFPVVLKDIKERPQRNSQMFAFLKFGTRSGQEFEAPAFATLWKHLSKRMKKGSVYIGTFNRRDDDPESLLVGRPGFAHSAHSAEEAMLDLDEAPL